MAAASQLTPIRISKVGRYTSQPGLVTESFEAWGHRDVRARNEAIALVYRELRRVAGAYMRCERRDHTLQPTALVHEAFVRLSAQNRAVWKNRTQFLAVAAQIMRRILVDHARSQRAAKRQGAVHRVELDEFAASVEPRGCQLLDLDIALTELEQLDPRVGRVVELRFFAGLSEDEIAEALGVSRSTVTREWQIGKAWLFRRVTTKQGSSSTRNDQR
jgi:RNA polymerase sigma-70 factor (ECF subfamily)